MQTEPCLTSMSMLRDVCRSWFEIKKIPGPIIFADLESLESVAQESWSDAINIVFFGGFLRRFVECETWKLKKIRIWVMSNASKAVFTTLLGFPETTISVIPRYELFPLAEIDTHEIDLSKNCTFVFSGRISPTKNIELLLLSCHELQKKYALPVKLMLIGKFDQQTHPDRMPNPRNRSETYESKIRKIIESLDWNFRPEIVKSMSPDSWYKLPIKNPIFISFSTYICEDFGVSLAQAQAAGWPCILSDWGAHQDAVQWNTRFLSPLLVGHTEESERMLRLRASILARHLVSSSRHKAGNAGFRPVSLVPDSVSVVDIKKRKKEFLKGVPRPEDFFSDTLEGASPELSKIYGQYRAVFGAPVSETKNCIVVDDLEGDELISDKEIHTVLGLVSSMNLQSNGIAVLPVSELFYRDSILHLLCCQQIFWPNKRSLASLKLKVSTLLADSVILSIYD